MKRMTSSEIRQMWLDFFASKGHMIEPGASLIPYKDPTLLWINSGVAALKKYFDGSVTPKNKRIANAQKSLRTNDIEHVGYTARHHTFFEMLGNFSIGDYFRKEALTWAMELLTSPKWFGFDLEKLYFTVHPSDKETYELWQKLGVNKDHIIFVEGNFWEIGEGPCGPNTEVFFDRGEKYDPNNVGVKLIEEDIENDRYIEIWNIVFSQYNAKSGLKREEYPELPSKNIDTGAGLERITCIMQNAETNFETDLFMPIINQVQKLASVPYEGNLVAYRVIADHIRTCTFALADGALFSNEGRGYVLRRILRRAVRYGRKIGINEPFLYRLVEVVGAIMNDYYGYINEKKDHIAKLVLNEEERFIKTLTDGEHLLLNQLEKFSDSKVLSGEVAFKLYDTYGFPYELTVEIAKEHGFSVDEEGFKKEMALQKERARSARGDAQSMKNQSADLIEFIDESTFLYKETKVDAKIIALFKDGERVDTLVDEGEVVFDKTVFYAESGGQVSDIGYIEVDGVKIEVIDVKKAPHFQHLHTVKIPQGYQLEVKDKATLEIDVIRRNRIRRHHSSAHLLQKALIEVLGDHISQAGSYVDDTKVRFDFTHFEKVSSEELKKIEARVNEIIDLGLKVETEIMSLEEAKNSGAIALFDEKYENDVRVVSMGDYSKELCGGTHVDKTSDIGCFAIESEESISSGIRRIVGSTGISAYKLLKRKEELLEQASHQLQALSIYEVNDRLQSLISQSHSLRKEIEQLKSKNASLMVDSLLANALEKDGYKLLVSVVDDFDKDALGILVDQLKDKLGSSLVYIINKSADKVNLIASATKDIVKDKNIHCGKLIKETASLLGGNGGGRPDIAQGAGKDASKIDQVITYLKNLD